MDGIYVDHAATTAVRPAAAQRFADVVEATGNPSSVHGAGRAARRWIEEARDAVAGYWGVHASTVIFTSGGTEANNLAIQGSHRRAGPTRDLIAISAIEHPSVSGAAEATAGSDHILRLPVSSEGILDVERSLELLIRNRARLSVVAVMAANNELGTIQPTSIVAQWCADNQIAFHCDAVQAAAWLRPDEWVVPNASMAVSGHKFGAPMGIGVLITPQDGSAIPPLTHGGKQEFGVRPGTTPTALIAAFATAVTSHASDLEQTSRRVGQYRQRWESSLHSICPTATVTGEGVDRLPSISSVVIPEIRAEVLLMVLDRENIWCSAGSACAAGVTRVSPALLATGMGPELAAAAIRVSFGWSSTDNDVQSLVTAFPAAVAQAADASKSFTVA